MFTNVFFYCFASVFNVLQVVTTVFTVLQVFTTVCTLFYKVLSVPFLFGENKRSSLTVLLTTNGKPYKSLQLFVH